MKIFQRRPIILFFLSNIITAPLFIARPAEPVRYSEVEQTWLASHPLIRVAPDPDFPPIEWFDKDGNLVGLAADYLKLVEKRLGVRFTIVRCKSWDEVLAKARDHTIDFLSAAAQTPDRAEYLLFSSPHIVLPGVIITRNELKGEFNLTKIRGLKVGLVSGYVWQEFITKDYPGIKLDAVHDIQTGLQNVSFGQSDVFIENLATATYTIEKEGITNLRVAGETGYYTRLSFATRKDWPELNSILEKGLQSITPEEKKAIYQKWIRLETRQSVFSYKTFWLAFGGTVAVALAAILLMVAWSQTLRRQVAQRTAALSAELAERARVEEALRESERRYRFLFEESPAGALIMGADGKIVGISKSLAGSLGYSPEEIIGKPAKDFVVEEEREEQVARLQRRFLDQQTEQAEVRVCARDGSTRTILFSAGQAVLRKDGKPDSVLVTGIDITDRKNAEMLAWQREQDLVKADKLSSLGTLVSGVAHEINNPNNFIILNAGNIRDVWASASLILESAYNGGDRFDLAGVDFRDARHDVPRLIQGIIDGAERIRVIVDNLKDFARPVSPAMNQSIDLNKVVEAARIILANMIKKSCDRFEVHLADEAPVCMGNFQKLEQVVINLVANACQALPDKNRGIRVSTFSSKGQVTLEVADEGSGIAEEHLSKVFDPFFTTKRDSGGTGLGLSISYSIAKEHKGDLTISSVVGRGTVARLSLPLLRTTQGESA